MKSKFLVVIFILITSALCADTWRLGEALALPDGGSLYVELVTDTGQKQGVFFDRRIGSATYESLFLGTHPEHGAKLMTQKERNYYMGVMGDILKQEGAADKLGEWKFSVLSVILKSKNEK